MADAELMDWYDEQQAMIEAYPRLLTALEQIRALPPVSFRCAGDGCEYGYGHVDGLREAAQIADAALRAVQGQGQVEKEGK